MSAKRIFPPLCMALFSCNDPRCSTSIWSLSWSWLLALRQGNALRKRQRGWQQRGFFLFFPWYPGIRDGLHWRWERPELIRAHGHQSMGCPPHVQGHVSISRVWFRFLFRSLIWFQEIDLDLLWSAKRWRMGLGIRLLKVYSPTVAG